MDEKIKQYRDALRAFMRTSASEYYGDTRYDDGVTEGLDIALAEFEKLFMEEK